MLTFLLHHRPGTVIYSDEWRAYFRIDQIPGGNYSHETMNYSQRFVDPVYNRHSHSTGRVSLSRLQAHDEEGGDNALVPVTDVPPGVHVEEEIGLTNQQPSLASHTHCKEEGSGQTCI